MLGAICGDLIGSRHEFNAIKTTEFDLLHEACRFTDDTVCTIAVAQSLLTAAPLEEIMVDWVLAHVDVGYGLDFLTWALKPDRKPYGSWGNGSAMRVSPVAWLATDLGQTATLAAETAALTHSHHHGLRGAKAVAVATRMALEGWSKEEIRNVVEDRFGYDLGRRTEDFRMRYRFEVSCQKSVPEALICFLEANSYEEAVRLCVSLGGDADTQAAMAGAVAEPFFGLSEPMAAWAAGRLTDPMRAVLDQFRVATRDRAYTRTDPAAIAVDRAPPREGDDPFSTEKVSREMQKIALLERVARGESPAPTGDGFLTKLRRALRLG